MLIDSHCHLDFAKLSEDRDAVVARARAAGVGRIVTICTKMQEYAGVRAIAGAYDDIYCTVGVHPEHAGDDGEDVSEADLTAHASDPKVIGFGETGLDYYYDNAPIEAQHRSFRAHIRAAKTTGLPLIIHSREAEEDTIRLLKEEGCGQPGGAVGVMHCFSSRRVLAEDALALGFYISMSGILTFKKSDELRSIARDVPLDRLLVETDAPFLAPEPLRGKPCEPAFVVHTARKLAEIKGVSEESLAAATTENFFRLFGKAVRP